MAISEEVRFNRQVNYIIIEKMWERFINKKKQREDKAVLYKLLSLSKNEYSRIRSGDTFQEVKLEKIWTYQKRTLYILGLSKEVMLGSEMIEIEGITKRDWEEYLECRYYKKREKENKLSVKIDNLDIKLQANRVYLMRCLNDKIKKAFNCLVANKRDTREIAKLFYFFTYSRPVTEDMPDAEMKELHNSLQKINISKMKVCDKALLEEIYKELKEKYTWLNIIMQYNGLPE